jgi:predicted metal-dependent hydrolase
MLIATRNFTLDRTLGAIELLRQDGITGFKAWAGLLSYMWLRPGMMRRIFRAWSTLLWYLWVRPGVFRKIAGAWVKFFLPGFHPWDVDDRDLLRRYEASAAATAAPAPSRKVRNAA